MVSFDGWAGPTEPSPSISKNFSFQSYFPKQQQNFGRNTYGSFRCDWKGRFNRAMSFHFLLMIPLIMSVWFGKWKALIACVPAGPHTHRLDHWYSPSSQRIFYVRYIIILTWLRGFPFSFLCAQVSSGNCDAMESWKICNFDPKSSESC